MKNISSVFLILFVTACIVSCKNDKEALSLYLYSPIGTVTVLSGGIQKTPQDGDFLSIGDSVRTGPLSSADILLGNIGIVRVYENSLIHIESLIDPATGDTKINMDQGKLYSTLEKLKKGSFQVKTPTSVASIRGTSFRMSAAQNESRLDVLDGKVQINPVQNNAVIENIKNLVEANQTVSIDRAAVIDAIKNKRELKVSALNPDEIKKIREEIKTLKPQLIKKMRAESRKKIEKKIQEHKEKAKLRIELLKKRKEEILEKREQLKEKREELLKTRKEKLQSRKEQIQENREKLNQKRSENKSALLDKREKLREQRAAAAAQRKAARKKKPAGNLSL